ncbi:MAG: MFS transporter [Chloroflexota bacterium]|nr:MFS transporter [Chloroflexota bacterium]
MAPPRRNLLLRSRDYLKLWTAATISLFGTQVSLVAIPVIAVLLLDAPPYQVALLGTVEFLPFLLFTLPAGAWVDRLPRRLILVVGDFGRAATLLTIPIAYELGGLTIWQLYVIGFLNGVLTVFFDVADQSFLPTILEPDDLIEGNSQLQISASAAQVLGQPLGGGLVGLLGAPIAILFDAISFVLSGGLIFWIRKREPKRVAGPAASGLLGPFSGLRGEIAEGLRYVLGHPYLRYIAACTGLSNLFGNVALATFAIFTYRTLELTPFTVGVIGGIGSVGILVGALVAGRIAERIGVGPTILWSAILFGPANLIAAFAQPGTAVPLLIASMFLGSFAGVVYNINQVSLRQAITPERIQGRMNATMRFLVWGTIPIGMIVGGAIASIPVLDARGALFIGGLLGCFSFVPILFSSVRTLQRIPAPERAPSDEALLDNDADMVGPGPTLD